MKFISLPQKPSVNLELPPLCSFRSGKGYLWALVRDKLHSLQHKSLRPLNILDAACHSLITRAMFPDKSSYYGLDISKHRLKSAFSLKRDNDVLIAADLTRPFTTHYHFDVLVSLNTLSHIPIDLHPQCLQNLLDLSNTGSSIFINTQIDKSLCIVVDTLMPAYETLSVVYFDSFLSERDELADKVTINNVNKKILKNELTLPNDASLHRQALVIASNKLHINSDFVQPSLLSVIKVSKLSPLPDFKNIAYDNDKQFASSVQMSNVSVLVSSGLLADPHFLKLVHLYNNLGVQLIPLSTNLPSSIFDNDIYILGLEDRWVSDIVDERFVLNLLRTKARVRVNLVHIINRFDVISKPSLLFQDT